MNSKKRLFTLSLVICLSLSKNLAFTQPTFSYTPGTFSFTLPAINNPAPPAPGPFYTLFIETGNGRYFKIPDGINGVIDGRINSNKNYNYIYSIPAGSHALATISGWYDTTPRPPRDISIVAENPNAQTLQNQANILSNKSRVAIDPCVSVIVPGDTMAVALTYKPFNTTGYSTLVSFFYNKPFDGGNIFSVIDGQTFYQFNTDYQTAAIRMFNHETVYTSIPSFLPLSVRQSPILDPVNSGYTNALYFLIPAEEPGTDETEKNIFLSLIPTKNISSYSPAPGPNTPTTTQFAATILRYNNSGIYTPQTISAPLSINLYARDPNEIKVFPQCFESEFRGRIYNRPIPVTISFLNDGGGVARDVENTLIVPDGIFIPPVLSNIYLNANGAIQQFKPWPSTDNNTYKIEGRKIIFLMKNINLLPLSPGGNIAHSRGIISFVLTTNSGPPIPECMYFDLSIVFFNKDHTRNSAVNKSALIRLHCVVANFPCLRSNIKKPDIK